MAAIGGTNRRVAPFDFAHGSSERFDIDRRSPECTPSKPLSDRRTARLIQQFWGDIMIKRFSVLFSFCLLGVVSEARAVSLPAPSVEYAADRIVETEAGTFEGKVYSARDKERSETNMGGMQSVMIVRRDQQIGWMLMPAQKMYREMDLRQAREQSGAAPDDLMEITQVGSESVEGFDSTKYKLVMQDGSAGGFIWITAQGIAVKMDMLSKFEGKKTRMTVTLKNVNIGSQDSRLFEVPPDYSAMPGATGAALGSLGMSKSPFSVGRTLKSQLFQRKSQRE
jgi:hypothetical protein